MFQTNEKDRFLGDIPEGQEEGQFNNDREQDEHLGAIDEVSEDEEEEPFEDCQDEESFTFVIDEEMIQFLETSAKHKLEISESKYILSRYKHSFIGICFKF